MMPVMLVTPELIWEIEVGDKSVGVIRALAKTPGDTSHYCEVAMYNEYHTYVPLAAINQIVRMHAAGALE